MSKHERIVSSHHIHYHFSIVEIFADMQVGTYLHRCKKHRTPSSQVPPTQTRSKNRYAFFIGTLCIYVVCTAVCLYCTVVVCTKGLVCAVETTWPAHRGQVCELVGLYRQGSNVLPRLVAPILINVSTEGDLVTYVPFKASLGLPTSGILDDSVRYAQGDTFGCWGEARALHSTQPVTSSLLPKAY